MKVMNNRSLFGACLWIVGHVTRPAVAVLADEVHATISNEPTVQSNVGFTEHCVKVSFRYVYRTVTGVSKMLYTWKGMLANVSANKKGAGLVVGLGSSAKAASGTALEVLVPVGAVLRPVIRCVVFFSSSALYGVALQ